MKTCDYRHGNLHQHHDIHGWFCHSIQENALESALHQYLATKK